MQAITSPTIDSAKVAQELESILNANLQGMTEKEAYAFILSVIDLTTLEGTDTNNKVIEVCRKAKSFNHESPNVPNVAAVCFYPPFIPMASQQLQNSGIQIASVAGAFPSGQSPLEVRLAEVKYAVENGADEIDMVISRGRFIEGDEEFLFHEVKEHKGACGDAHLKVILETGELKDLTLIRRASDISISAGADFIKTSTGKIQPAATLEAFYVMLGAIKDHYDKTGIKIGIKPAGGISEPEVAIQYVKVLKAVLGEEWMTKKLFRIGASRLANKVYELIA